MFLVSQIPCSLSLVLQIPPFHVPGLTDSGFSCSWFYRFQLFMFLVLQIPPFHVPGFTDSGFSCSWFDTFHLFMFLVLKIPGFHVPGFTDSGFSCSLFYRFRLFMFLVLQILAFHVPGFLVPCSVPRSVPRFPVPCFTHSLKLIHNSKLAYKRSIQLDFRALLRKF